MLNKDFYVLLPRYLVDACETMIVKYKDEPWFEVAWTDYGKRVFNRKQLDVLKHPFVFFEEAKKEYEKAFDEVLETAYVPEEQREQKEEEETKDELSNEETVEEIPII